MPAQAVEKRLYGIGSSDRKDVMSLISKLVKDRDLVVKICIIWLKYDRYPYKVCSYCSKINIYLAI